MTGHPKPAPPPAAKPQVWFPDTSALITLAVHLPLHEVTVDALAAKRRVLLAAVVAELEGLTRQSQPSASWANTALGQLGWLGKPVVMDSPTGTALASEIQQDLAAGRSLLITRSRITVEAAASFSDALRDAGRSPDFTADELRSGRLKRVGEP